MIEELMGILGSANLSPVLYMIAGFFLGIVTPTVLKAYLRLAQRILERKRVWYVQVAGPAGAGKTTLIHRLVGESGVNPGLTLDVIKYRRPVYIRNRLYDIIFSDGLGEQRAFSSRGEFERDSLEARRESFARTLILVVGPTGRDDEEFYDRKISERHYDDREEILKYFSPSFLDVLRTSLPRLRKVIVFFNKADLSRAHKNHTFEAQKEILLKSLSDFRNLEISVRIGSAATGEGVADLFSEVVSQIHEASRHDH